MLYICLWCPPSCTRDCFIFSCHVTAWSTITFLSSIGVSCSLISIFGQLASSQQDQPLRCLLYLSPVLWEQLQNDCRNWYMREVVLSFRHPPSLTSSDYWTGGCKVYILIPAIIFSKNKDYLFCDTISFTSTVFHVIYSTLWK